MTEIIEANKKAMQYQYLVYKITKQFVGKSRYEWKEVESMAWEGLAIAFNKYDIQRSKLSFTQYAAWSIRNNILNCLTEEMRTVKMSLYMQQKAQANVTNASDSEEDCARKNNPAFSTVRIDVQRDDESVIPSEIKTRMYEDEKFSNGNVMEYLYYRIDSNFSERDRNIFYMSFGLKDFDEMKGKDIAAALNISEPLVSVCLKKVISWIRKDNDLCEMLSSLL